MVGATLAGFLVPAEEDTTAAADKMSAKVGSAANSMHGYFKGLLVGYALDQVGGALLGGLESAVSDAPFNPERIAQLADQINKQKAAIAQHQAELDKWVGTTAQVDASRYAAATAIARLPSWSDSCNPYGCPAGSRQEGDGYAAAAKLVAPEDRLRIVCHDVAERALKRLVGGQPQEVLEPSPTVSTNVPDDPSCMLTPASGNRPRCRRRRARSSSAYRRW